MEWTKQSPQSPGIYWYQHRDQEKHSKASNRPEPVKLTSDGRILFLGPVVILEGNNDIEIVIHPDFGQTCSHALTRIGRILEQSCPDQMGHLALAEIKLRPRIDDRDDGFSPSPFGTSLNRHWLFLVRS